MSMNELKERIRVGRASYAELVDELAKQAREEFVVPLCKKLKARYIVGNGIFFFSVPTDNKNWFQDQHVSYEDEIKQYPKLVKLMRPALEVINLDVYSFCHGTDSNPVALLGYYIQDVK